MTCVIACLAHTGWLELRKIISSFVPLLSFVDFHAYTSILVHVLILSTSFHSYISLSKKLSTYLNIPSFLHLSKRLSINWCMISFKTLVFALVSHFLDLDNIDLVLVHVLITNKEIDFRIKGLTLQGGHEDPAPSDIYIYLNVISNRGRIKSFRVKG